MQIFLTIIAYAMIGLGALLLYDAVLLVWRGRYQATTWLSALLAFAVIGIYLFVLADLPHLSLPLCACGISPAQSIALLLDLIGLYVVATFIVFCVRTAVCVRYLPDPGFAARLRYIIVLGGGLVGRRVGRLLATRLQKGIECLTLAGGNGRAGENNDADGGRDAGSSRCRIIASGGQGADEEVPEASAMRDYLLAQGVADGLIVMEDCSRTTAQNLMFSGEVIRSLERRAASGVEATEAGVAGAAGVGVAEATGAGVAGAAEAGVAGAMEAAVADETGTATEVAPATVIVTNDFHALRAFLLARKVGFRDFEVVSCRTLWYYFPAAFIRDFIGYERIYGMWFIAWVAFCAAVVVLGMVAGLL